MLLNPHILGGRAGASRRPRRGLFSTPPSRRRPRHEALRVGQRLARAARTPVGPSAPGAVSGWQSSQNALAI